MAANKRTDHEIERGEIMRFLAELGFRPATPRSILAHLDYMGYSVTDEVMAFHLRYLASKGLIEIELFDRNLGQAERVRIATITAAGVDALDLRRKGELGARF
jgi:repressor of nif and glnA expression